MHVNFPPEVDAQRFRGHAVLIAAAEQSRNRGTIGWSQLRSAEQWSKTDQKKIKSKKHSKLWADVNENWMTCNWLLIIGHYSGWLLYLYNLLYSSLFNIILSHYWSDQPVPFECWSWGVSSAASTGWSHPIPWSRKDQGWSDDPVGVCVLGKPLTIRLYWHIYWHIYIYWLYINYSIQNFRIIEHIELWNEMKSHWYFGWKPVEIPFHNQIQNCKCPLGARREPPPPVILVEGDFLELGEVEAKALVPFEALGDGNIVVKFDEVFLHWLLRLWLTTKDVIDDDWLLRIWLTIIGY